jgi:hypothetical protein
MLSEAQLSYSGEVYGLVKRHHKKQTKTNKPKQNQLKISNLMTKKDDTYYRRENAEN